MTRLHENAVKILMIYLLAGTGFCSFTVAVEVVDVLPPGGSHSAAVATDLTVTLDAALDTGTVNSSTFFVNGSYHSPVTGSFNTDTNAFVFDPAVDFHPGEVIQASVTEGVTAAGDPVDPYVWSFRTAVTGGMGVFSDSGQVFEIHSCLTVALGDLDGDSDLDAFILNSLNQGNRVWMNNSGFFMDSGQSLGAFESQNVELGDLDGDGDLDVFVTNWYQANRIYMNDGSGVFPATGQALGTGGNTGVSLGDLDGDGDLDVIIAKGPEQGTQIWLNNGNGQFSDTGQSLGISCSADISLGDLDGDGDLDGFEIHFGSGNRVLLNDGTGVFSDTGQRLGSASSYDLSLGDLDSDGDLDAFVINIDDSDRVWQNNSDGTFTDSGQILGDIVTMGLDLGDVDGDGDLDACITQVDDSRSNCLLLNDGSGFFTPGGQDWGDNIHSDVALGDLDGDGDLDAFFSNTGSPGSKVWFNNDSQTPTPTLTPTPTETPTPEPTHYPVWTPTHPPHQTPTPTPVCDPCGCIITMPSHFYTPGDTYFTEITLCNPNSYTISNVPVFAILDVYGTCFFAPSFTEFDYWVHDISPGQTVITVVQEFNWPQTAGAATGVIWYAGMTNPEMSAFFSRWDEFEFGWGN